MLGFLLLKWRNCTFPPIPLFLFLWQHSFLTSLISFPLWSRIKASPLDGTQLPVRSLQETKIHLLILVDWSEYSLYIIISTWVALVSAPEIVSLLSPFSSLWDLLWSFSPLWIRAVSCSLYLLIFGSCRHLYSTGIYAGPIMCHLFRAQRHLGDHL